MNREEIKETYSMRQIIEAYGFHITRAGFCKCPFHAGDETPSLRVYERDFFCYACQAHGDIFTFTMRMEHCDFRTAFQFLGGEYEKLPLEEYLKRKAERERQKAEREAEKQRLQDEKRLNGKLIDLYRRALKTMMPLSEGWAMIYDALRRETYRCGELNGLVVDAAGGVPVGSDNLIV